jgi:hypothetical protein
MKLPLFIILLLSSFEVFADMQKPTDIFFEKLEVIRAEYRKGFSEELKKCDRIYIYLVDFDDIIDTFDPFSGDDEKRIRIHPYGHQSTKILKEKELTVAEKKIILAVLADQISVETQHGGAFCHFPIHGLKAYSGDRLLLESTFCWKCGNFGFDYPNGAQWLDATKEMEVVFKQLLPIPESEITRFRQKHSATPIKQGDPVE